MAVYHMENEYFFFTQNNNISTDHYLKTFTKNSDIPNVKHRNGTFNLLARGGKTHTNGPGYGFEHRTHPKTFYDRIIKLYDGRVSDNKWFLSSPQNIGTYIERKKPLWFSERPNNRKKRKRRKNYDGTRSKLLWFRLYLKAFDFVFTTNIRFNCWKNKWKGSQPCIQYWTRCVWRSTVLYQTTGARKKVDKYNVRYVCLYYVFDVIVCVRSQ